LFHVEKEVSRLVFVGYNSLREMFQCGYTRAKIHSQDLLSGYRDNIRVTYASSNEDGKEASEVQKENDAEMNSLRNDGQQQIRDVRKRKSPYHLFSQLNSKRPSVVKKQQSIIL
jgi:hypothetical protein